MFSHWGHAVPLSWPYGTLPSGPPELPHSIPLLCFSPVFFCSPYCHPILLSFTPKSAHSSTTSLHSHPLYVLITSLSGVAGGLALTTLAHVYPPCHPAISHKCFLCLSFCIWTKPSHPCLPSWGAGEEQFSPISKRHTSEDRDSLAKLSPASGKENLMLNVLATHSSSVKNPPTHGW